MIKLPIPCPCRRRHRVDLLCLLVCLSLNLLAQVRDKVAGARTEGGCSSCLRAAPAYHVRNLFTHTHLQCNRCMNIECATRVMHLRDGM
jgi:hypothetical protein